MWTTNPPGSSTNDTANPMISSGVAVAPGDDLNVANSDEPHYMRESALCGGCHVLAVPKIPTGYAAGVAIPPENPPWYTYPEACDAATQKTFTGNPLTDPCVALSYEQATYFEWVNSAFATTGDNFDASKTCQGCHMPPKTDLFNSVDVSSADDAGITFGFGRPPERLRSHTFRGPLMVVDGMPRLLDGAAQLDLVAGPAGGQLEVTTTVENIGCGHALPTGEPMRALLLVLRVEGCGSELTQTSGATLDDLAGAIEIGVVGVDATIAGTVVTWTAGAAKAQPGQLVRVVRRGCADAPATVPAARLRGRAGHLGGAVRAAPVCRRRAGRPLERQADPVRRPADAADRRGISGGDLRRRHGV